MVKKKHRFGFVFAESFITEKQDQGLRALPGLVNRRAVVFKMMVVIIWVLIGGRLVQLQLVQGAENRRRSDENRVVIHRVRAPRGAIFDRQGEVLTRNIPVYKLRMDDLSAPAYADRPAGGQWKIVSREEAESLEKRGEKIFEDVGREYLAGEPMAHVLGYLGEIDEAELNEASRLCQVLGKKCDYNLGDLVGELGIERVYEDWLKGVSGGVVQERLANGQVIRQLSDEKPQPGRDLQLTVDTGLQKAAYEALESRPGAVVVSRVENGEILALVSSPSFNPGKVALALEDSNKPLFNRALSGLYPPGSVYKLVTAVASLEEGAIDETTQFEDTGEIKIGKFRYGNWYFDQYGRTEGFLDVVGALKRSNDIFFYKAGEAVGPEKLALWAKKFGFGRVSGLNLGPEAEGVVPDPEWKETVKGERWFLGNTYHVAIGQGDLQVTPIQVHQMLTVVANDGRLCQPSLVQTSGFRQQNCEDLGISKKTLRLVQEGMVEACKTRGTAYPFFNFSTAEASPSASRGDKDRVACKTGTAQFNDPEGRTHAWLVAYGPAFNPEIAVTVLLEKGGEGSDDAAPVAKKVFEYWFHQRK